MSLLFYWLCFLINTNCILNPGEGRTTKCSLILCQCYITSLIYYIFILPCISLRTHTCNTHIKSAPMSYFLWRGLSVTCKHLISCSCLSVQYKIEQTYPLPHSFNGINLHHNLLITLHCINLTITTLIAFIISHLCRRMLNWTNKYTIMFKVKNSKLSTY